MKSESLGSTNTASLRVKERGGGFDKDRIVVSGSQEDASVGISGPGDGSPSGLP